MRSTALCAMALLLFSLPASAATRTIDRIAAVIDEQPILLSEVEERAAMLRVVTPPERRRLLMNDALDDLLADRLFAKQVKELNLEVSDAEVQAAVDDVVRQNGFSSPEQLETAVAAQGMTMASYRDSLKKQLSQMKLLNLRVRSKVKVDEEEVKRRYAELGSAEEGEEEVHARHILLRVAPDAPAADVEKAEQRARAIADRARAGEEFEKLARETSEGDSGAEGGDLGWFRRGEMAKELEDSAFHLASGEISEPVRTRFGWHVVQVMERRAVAAPEFEAVAARLREALYREEMERQTQRYLDELKKAAVIEYRIPELEPKAR